MINIEEEWKTMAALTLPPNASTIQRNETRRAFYAGFACCMERMMELTELEEDRATESLSGISRQVIEFFERVKIGDA